MAKVQLSLQHREGKFPTEVIYRYKCVTDEVEGVTLKDVEQHLYSYILPSETDGIALATEIMLRSSDEWG